MSDEAQLLLDAGMTPNNEDATCLESGNEHYADIANDDSMPRVKSFVISTVVMVFAAIAAYSAWNATPMSEIWVSLSMSTGTIAAWAGTKLIKSFFSTYIDMEFMRITDEGLLAVYTWIPNFFSKKKVETVTLMWNEIANMSITRLMDEGADYHRVCFFHSKTPPGFEGPPMFMWPLGIFGDQSEKTAQELLEHFLNLKEKSLRREASGRI